MQNDYTALLESNNLKTSTVFAFAILFILLLSMFLPLCMVDGQVSSELPLHELLLNKEIFTRGQTLNITVRANVATVQISMHSPENLFLNYNQAANTSTTFLVDDDWSFGSWNITATFGNIQTGRFFSLFNDGDYINASFPYSVVHLGTNYTIVDAGVNATLMSTNRSLVITYPTILSLNQTTVIEYNNMSVRTITLFGNDSFIVSYAFVNSGVKFSVNGSTEVSNNFEFSLNSSGSQRDNSFRSGNLVFDWSDVAASGLSVSWSDESKALSVDVGSTFQIDAFIYADGFESGDVNSGGWDWYGYEPSVVSAPNSAVWKGNYSCLVGNQGDSGLIKYIYGNDTSTVNVRAYFYMSTLPSINQSTYLSWITGMYDMGNGSSISHGVAAMLAYSDENHSKLGLSQPWNSSELPVFNTIPTLIRANSWSCIEIGINSTGSYLWVNGALELATTVWCSQGQLNEGSIFVGNAYHTEGYLPESLYIDEVAYSDPYLGLSSTVINNPPELSILGMPENDSQSTTVGSLSVTGTVNLYSGQNCAGSKTVFTDTDVNWEGLPLSLEVDGTVTLFNDSDCQGYSVTYTNEVIPYDNLGTEWNQNSELIKSQGKWDCRSHNWIGGFNPLYLDSSLPTECLNEPPTDSYKMNWVSDGQVSGYCSDDLGFWWHTCDLAQGFDCDSQTVYNLTVYPRAGGLPYWSNWDNQISSFKLTLNENGYLGVWDSPGCDGDPDYIFVGDSLYVGDYWNDKISSLLIYNGTVTFYEDEHYQGESITFTSCASYQPTPLPVASQSILTLEAVVSNPYYLNWWDDMTGAKFDVWALGGGKSVMLELYFARGGLNLLWPTLSGTEWFRQDSDTGASLLMDINRVPQYATRIVYSNGDIKYNIDVKGIIQHACDLSLGGLNYDINALEIRKIAFTLEADAINSPLVLAGCDIHRLRLCYGSFQTETISVDYFSDLYDSWGEYGQAPYLDEGTNSYIYESGNDIGDGEGLFYFSHPANGQGEIESVKLKLFCGQSDPQERMQFNVSVAQAKNTTLTSSSYVFYQNYIVTPQYEIYTGDGSWEEIDITSWVYNWETLDNVRLKFIYRSYYADYTVRVYSAEIEITYWPIVSFERDIVIFGNQTSYPWIGDWADMLINFGYTYTIVDPSEVSRGVIGKAHALIVAPNIVNELPGRNNLWGASLIQQASADIPVLCHMFSYTSQVCRQNDVNYGDGWGPLQSSYKHSNATSIKDPSGADMQNITFSLPWSYFSDGAVVPFYNYRDGYLRTVNSDSAYWNSYASHMIVAKEYGSQNYAAIVHGNFYGGEGILAVDLEAIYDDWNCRNLIFYPWLDKVDFEIGQDKCPTSNYLKHWYANGYEYLSYSDVQSAIANINSNDGGEISTFSLGQSVQGRDITALQIGSGSEVVLIVGGIHGNEKATVAGALNLADVLDNLYLTDPKWEHLLDSHIKVVIVPCNNPDGYVSNTRDNYNGVDLNRNYDYGVDTPFSQPETRAIMNFVGNNTIKSYVGFHMGSNGKYLVEGTTEGFNRHDYPYRDFAYMLGYTTNETLINDVKIFSNDNNRIRKIGDSATIMGQAFNGTQALHVMLNEDCPTVTYEALPGFDSANPSKSSARLMGTSVIQITVVGLEMAHLRYETLVPNGEGAYSEFSYLSSGSTHYDKVDDNTDFGDGDNTWVGSNSMNVQRELYSLPSLSGYSSGMSIGKVSVFVIGRGTTGPNIVLPSLGLQSAFYSGSNQNLVITYSMVNCTWSINPYTGATWTNSDIDNLQIGQKADHAALRVTEVYAVVEYDFLHT
jgi:hypothetical protein